ncbi:hypothetical protein FGRMN_6608 [Fusarium graminum]|nr:hypothetical protein FGRMN_6608 [Fusarium graminum]
MSPKTDIQSLPIETLTNILSYVRDDRANGQEFIKQSRLVSRRFNDAASTLLMPQIFTCLTVESFARLENICSHPIFSKNVAHVTIILNFYEEALANDRALFMREARSRLLRHCETMERMPRYRSKFYLTKELSDWLAHLCWDRCPKLNQMVEEDSTQTPPARVQKLFLKLYDIYKKRYEDQKDLRRDNAHIDRLVAALSSLPGLVSLTLQDYNSNRAIVTSNTQRGSDKLVAADFLDSGYEENVLRHFDRAVRSSPWQGSFYTKQISSPPVEMLGELCSQLGRHGVRPRHFNLFMNHLADMRLLQISPAQQENIKQLVSLVTSTELSFDLFYERKSYSKEELLALCSLTSSFASSSNLETLKVSFGTWTPDSTMHVSLADVLPLDTTWPRLQRLYLRNQKIKLSELRQLQSKYGNTLRELDLRSDFVDCSPSDVSETMRGFKLCGK